MRLLSAATERLSRSRRYRSNQVRCEVCHAVVPRPRDEVMMKRILELTRREQRIVILIVAVLVVFACARHCMETRSNPRTSTSAQLEQASTTPTVGLNEEEMKSPSPHSSQRSTPVATPQESRSGRGGC